MSARLYPPVDSTTHRCCGGIGRHTQECPGHRPPLPPHTHTLSGWETDECGTVRIVYGEAVTAGDVSVTPCASQDDRGGFIDTDGDRPLVLVDELVNGQMCERLQVTPTVARELAAALISAADEVDGWLGI